MEIGTIKEIDWHDRVLTVKLLNSHVHKYQNVPYEIFLKLLDSSSKENFIKEEMGSFTVNREDLLLG